jgi:hypothetical protein
MSLMQRRPKSAKHSAAARINGARGGRPKGSLEHSTLAKKFARQRIQELVTARLDEIVGAQLENAKGVQYMVLRRPDGSFARATDADMIDEACKLGAEAFQIFTMQPHQQSAALLLGYAADKPVEPHEHTGAEGGPMELTWKVPSKT